MKIAIVCPYNIFKPGGVQEHVKAQAAILRSRGHTVTVITPRPRSRDAAAAPDGVVFVGGSARIKTPSATSSDVSISVDIEAVDTVLADGSFDVVHVHEPIIPFLARQILPRTNALRVGTFHAALPGNALGKSLVRSYRVYTKSVLPYIDVITAVSPAAVGFIDNLVDEREVNYIPNGISYQAISDTGIVRDRNQILFIGRLEKRKGALYAIKAFAVLKQKRPELSLVICGDGPLRESLELYVERHGISDVEFKGFITDEEKYKALATCGVYTSPALYGESFGIVLAEAMAMGAPVVAHKNEGYAWVLQQTGRISLVDVHDIDAYADRIQLLLEDDTLRAAWQKWAKKYVLQYDYERVVDQYEALYKRHIS